MTTARRPGRWRKRTAGAAAVWLVLAGAGCARNRPVTAPPPVALNVPPPPPRVISMPPEPVAPTEATTVERAAPVSRPARTTRSASSRPETPRPPEPARSEAVPEPTAPPATAEPTSSGPLLRTPQTADESVAERRTRDVLTRAEELLRKVELPSLSVAARQQYETAKRFIQQAGQAMVARNFVLATYLADKAETLAKGLSR